MKNKVLLSMVLALAALCACATTQPESSANPSSIENPSEIATSSSTVEQSSSSSEAPYNKPASPISPAEVFEAKTYEDARTGKALPYRLYLPDGYDAQSRYPVLFFLHGSGERGIDNARQLTNSFPKLFADVDSPIYGSIVVCPQCPGQEQWVDTPYAEGNYRLADVPTSEVMRTLQGENRS